MEAHSETPGAVTPVRTSASAYMGEPAPPGPFPCRAGKDRGKIRAASLRLGEPAPPGPFPCRAGKDRGKIRAASLRLGEPAPPSPFPCRAGKDRGKIRALGLKVPLDARVLGAAAGPPLKHPFFPPRRQATLSWLGGLRLHAKGHGGNPEPGTKGHWLHAYSHGVCGKHEENLGFSGRRSQA